MSKDGDSVGDVGGSGRGSCALLVVLVVGLVGVLGVLGLTQRILELAVGLDMDESQEGPQQAPEGEDEG